MCAVKNATGILKGNISKCSGVTLIDAEKVTGKRLWATRWIAGGEDALYYTTGSLTSDWGELVDFDPTLSGKVIKAIAYGEDDHGGKSWALGTNDALAPQGVCEDFQDALVRNFDALGDDPKWELKTFTGSAHIASGGPGIAFANGVWIAGGFGADVGGGTLSSIKKSTDGGATWTQITDIPVSGFQTRVICYKSGNTWFATNDSDIWKSTNDGDSWTDVDDVINGILYCMAFDGIDTWVAAGTVGDLVWSDDDWATSSDADPGFGTSKIWGVVFVERLEKWIVVGQHGKVSMSSDRSATSWTLQRSGGGTLNAVATDGRDIIASGDGGRVLHSTDGSSWTSGTSGLSGDLESIACDIIGSGMR